VLNARLGAQIQIGLGYFFIEAKNVSIADPDPL
jgi:hypothetical protein